MLHTWDGSILLESSHLHSLRKATQPRRYKENKQCKSSGNHKTMCLLSNTTGLISDSFQARIWHFGDPDFGKICLCFFLCLQDIHVLLRVLTTLFYTIWEHIDVFIEERAHSHNQMALLSALSSLGHCELSRELSKTQVRAPVIRRKQSNCFQ